MYLLRMQKKKKKKKTGRNGGGRGRDLRSLAEETNSKQVPRLEPIVPRILIPAIVLIKSIMICIFVGT